MQRRSLGPFSVAPVGFGAMRLTGPNVFGPPKDRGEAIRVLRAAVAGGVNHIDTAQFYGPDVVNELIREALHPYPADLVIVSKVGARRDQRGRVLVDDEPQQLRAAIEANLRTLAVDTLPVVNLRLMRRQRTGCVLRRSTRRDDRGARRRLDPYRRPEQHHTRPPASRVANTEIACVQNLFHLADRASQPVLDACTKRGIAFVPFGSLGFGVTARGLSSGDEIVVEEAARLGLTPAQLALAWALALAPNVLVIPGASAVDHFART